MKKLITLSFALFAIAGYAFGQTGSDLNNEAIIEQATANNQGDIIQRGKNNQAKIGQGKWKQRLENDERDFLDFEQGIANNNKASILQIGDQNFGVILQGTSDGTAVQNEATLQIAGSFNSKFNVNITQGQGSNGLAKFNSASIYINGNRTKFANIVQADLGSKAIGNEASIRINGNNNSSRILQGSSATTSAVGTALWNDADIRQGGNRNDADITQGFFQGIAINNQALINQPGNSNEAEIQQGTLNNLRHSDASITQRSNNNNAIIDMAGINQSASIIQSN